MMTYVCNDCDFTGEHCGHVWSAQDMSYVRTCPKCGSESFKSFEEAVIEKLNLIEKLIKGKTE